VAIEAIQQTRGRRMLSEDDGNTASLTRARPGSRPEICSPTWSKSMAFVRFDLTATRESRSNKTTPAHAPPGNSLFSLTLISILRHVFEPRKTAFDRRRGWMCRLELRRRRVRGRAIVNRLFGDALPRARTTSSASAWSAAAKSEPGGSRAAVRSPSSRSPTTPGSACTR
jgi:hypothetical protein